MNAKQTKNQLLEQIANIDSTIIDVERRIHILNKEMLKTQAKIDTFSEVLEMLNSDLNLKD